MPDKRYLGDSVYAEWDSQFLILTTENGYGPNNTILLEPEVIVSLEDFLKAVKDELNSNKG